MANPPADSSSASQAQSSSVPSMASTSSSATDSSSVPNGAEHTSTDGSKRIKLASEPPAASKLPLDNVGGGEVKLEAEVGRPAVEALPAAEGSGAVTAGSSGEFHRGERTDVGVDGEGEGEDSRIMTVVEEVVFPMICGWKGEKYELNVPESDTVGDLKALLFSLTSVPPDRQKIVGLVAGKLPTDDVAITSLQLGAKNRGKGTSFTMIGTPQGDEIKRPEEMGDVANDMDIDYSEATKPDADPATNARNRRKLVEASNQLNLNIMNPPRPGKKLLVLDLDYTLLDAKAYSDPTVHALDMSRPYLQEFLTVLSPFYDFCIWSQTHWRWLESKLVELNMVGGPNDHRYLINFVIDRTPMFSVYSSRDGKPFKHEVKALEIIWRKVPQYNATNTLHLDDLSRNFAMNPRNGVKCHAFKNARRHQADRELIHLAKYFLKMATVDDVRAFDHSKWRKCALGLPPNTRDPEEDLPPGYDRDKALGKSKDA